MKNIGRESEEGEEIGRKIEEVEGRRMWEMGKGEKEKD